MVSILCWCSPASCGGAWGDDEEFQSLAWHEPYLRAKRETADEPIALQAEPVTSDVTFGNAIQNRVLLGRVPVFSDAPGTRESKHNLKQEEQTSGAPPEKGADSTAPQQSSEHGLFTPAALSDAATTSAAAAAAAAAALGKTVGAPSFHTGGANSGDGIGDAKMSCGLVPEPESGTASHGELCLQQQDVSLGTAMRGECERAQPGEGQDLEQEDASERSAGEVRLVTATREWRYVAASRELRALEVAAATAVSQRLGRLSDNSKNALQNGIGSNEARSSSRYAGLGKASLARVRRIGAHYEANLDMIQWKATDFAISEVGCKLGQEGGLEEWGARLQDGYLSMVTSTHYATLDVSTILACRMEKDLEPHLDKEVIHKEILEESDVSDSLWHVLKNSKSLGSKLDDVSEDFVVDALDESVGAIVMFSRTLDPTTTTYRGLTIPKPQEGFERTPHYRGLIKLQRDPKGGVRSIFAMQVKLSVSAYRLLSLMPNWVFRRLVRSGAENSTKNFRMIASDPNSVYQERLRTTPRAAFYDAMQRRMSATFSTA